MMSVICVTTIVPQSEQMIKYVRSGTGSIFVSLMQNFVLPHVGHFGVTAIFLISGGYK